MTWRTGGAGSRLIFLQSGTEPSVRDSLIGEMDTADRAERVCLAVNLWELLYADDPPRRQAPPTAQTPDDIQAIRARIARLWGQQ